MDIASLSDGIKAIAYPTGISCVEPGILGQGFYPGSRGFPEGMNPSGGIMLLGRDFGTREYYESLVGIPSRDEYALTWRHTRDIWLSAGQPSLAKLPVWCTNYLMGLRNDGSAKGNIRNRVSGEEWLAFEESCWSFLHQQVLLQRPCIIVVFGEDNRKDLLSPGRLRPNSDDRGIRHTFECRGISHSASVMFASHPHSLIPHTAKLVAARDVERVRTLYLSLAKLGSN